jgi:hypothetical protein
MAENAPEPAERLSSVRLTPDNKTVLEELGLLADLAGTWEGHGFNLIARPDHEHGENLYLQLNQTDETLKFDPIGSPIPNRGFGQNDIELLGLTYLDKIHDAPTGGALHIEPGIWITQPSTEYPSEEAAKGDQIVSRMASIPHGNAMLARGVASSFNGPPTLTTADEKYASSLFPAFNSTPNLAGRPLLAAGSSELLSKPNPPRFEQYNLAVPAGPGNSRTPFETVEPPLPAAIDGVPMQDVVNDPIRLLQAVIERQEKDGHTFQGTALNIATRAELSFFNEVNKTSAPGEPDPPSTAIKIPFGSGGIENIPFLEGGEPVGNVGPNALTAIVYATFWIERVSHPRRRDFMQLQYAQMTMLDFHILAALPAPAEISWPHISVATLRRAFI